MRLPQGNCENYNGSIRSGRIGGQFNFKGLKSWEREQ